MMSVLADISLNMRDIALLLAIVTTIVLFICICGFVAFVRWGEKDRKKNRDKSIEEAMREPRDPEGHDVL